MGRDDFQWEYCQLLLLGVERGDQAWRYQLAIRYLGSRSQTLSRLKGERARDWDVNPWELAMAQLGVAGWELVTVQHANVSGDMGGGGEIGYSEVVAYFKRVIQSGRAIDEPELALE